ncbi:cysteine proteinase [Karstenula rhodostoma CBS 690.94]|uniref:Cysteine proteinase n=1 Tax=Karstenula rhodostoma CBS 690.94 TaxID=1392251 RepID=A0A9P4PNL1_9PLEO|nr:cysteine proteinase [Karstenula rhodostoma CBS 690.94]
MPKPGANHAHQPKNTLTQQTYHPPSGVHKTYGRSSRPDDFVNFLDEGRFDTRPTKKRRTDTTDAITVYDEGEIQEIRPKDQTPRPVSHRSASSRSFTLPGAKDPRSEFGRASAVVDPRRKKARTSTSNGNSGFINGGAQPAILIDDDDVLDSSANPRKLQLQKFQQGVEQPRDRASGQQVHETTSKHFAPKMNHSTLALDASNQRTVRRSNNLRDSFSRGPVSDASARDRWPLRWIRAHDLKESREDLFLDSRILKEYRVTSSDRNDIKYEIKLKDVRKAETDHTSRIRLTGSTSTANNVQYMVDLEFQDEQNLATFSQAVSNSIKPNQVALRTEEFMNTIFQKPLAVTSQPLNKAPPLDIQNQVQQVSNAAKPRLLNNLSRVSDIAGLKTSSSSATAPARTETRRLSERPVRTTRASKPLTVDLEDFEDLAEVERFSEIHGLGPPWKKPLNYNSGRRRAVVDFKDLERLDDGQFLNDQLIDFYLLYLFDQAKVPRDKVYLFNTHFFTTLTRKVPGQKGWINYQGVARWTAKEDIFGYDYIVVPINQDVHWYLAIICNVSNIARTPAIEDLAKSDEVGSAASKELDSEPPGHEAKIADLPSIPSPALVDPPSESSTSNAAIEVVDPDDSDLNLVDPRATGPDHGLSAPSGCSSVAESPAAETAQMKNLTLSDSKPEGILLGSSSSAGPKKPKRRLRPPPKKRDVNESVIVVLDSLGGSAKTAAVRVLKDYIRAEGEEKRGMKADIPSHAFYAKEGQIPQQQNYVDCGVYLLGYAQQFFENPDLFKNRILSGEMQVETDWPDMTMSSMRAGMRDILQRLNREQEEEREQARRQKKQGKRASPDATVDATKNSVEQKAAVVAEQAEKPTLTVDAKNATPIPEMNNAPIQEEPSTMSSVQPHPRLASPFQPRPPQKRDRSRSKSVPAPTQTDVPNTKGRVTPATDGQNASPTTGVPHRSRSPIVSIPPPSRKSPKRPRELILVGDSPEETTKKKVRTDLKSPKDFMDGDPRIVGIRSPDSKAAVLPKRREKVSTPRVASVPPRGSSRDPIQLDESQEAPMSTDAAPQSTKRNSQGPDFIITTPKSARGARLPPTRQRQQHMSSPARSNIQRGSPVRRRETRSANESPDPIVDLDDLDLPPQRIQSHSSRPNRSRWRAKTPDEDIPEKTIEVPETPPHDG